MFADAGDEVVVDRRKAQLDRAVGLDVGRGEPTTSQWVSHCSTVQFSPTRVSRPASQGCSRARTLAVTVALLDDVVRRPCAPSVVGEIYQSNNGQFCGTPVPLPLVDAGLAAALLGRGPPSRRSLRSEATNLSRASAGMRRSRPMVTDSTAPLLTSAYMRVPVGRRAGPRQPRRSPRAGATSDGKGGRALVLGWSWAALGKMFSIGFTADGSLPIWCRLGGSPFVVCRVTRCFPHGAVLASRIGSIRPHWWPGRVLQIRLMAIVWSRPRWVAGERGGWRGGVGNRPPRATTSRPVMVV